MPGRSSRAGEKIEIRSFRTRTRRARIGPNPRTGAQVNVPAKKTPFFTPCRTSRRSGQLRGRC
ncbi:MAG TPA: HU family DNA-binding protein [Bryobacteraceae bacterium]|nr:HU family DNA-binding protein [Bryobacteraceae bacterium]